MATKTVIIDSPKTNNVVAIRTCKETGFSVGLRFSLDENKQKHVKIATAILGTGDKFTHKKGRAIILERFDSEQFIVVPYTKFYDHLPVVNSINIDATFEGVDELLGIIS